MACQDVLRDHVMGFLKIILSYLSGVGFYTLFEMSLPYRHTFCLVQLYFL